MKTKLLLVFLMVVCFILANLVPLRAMWQPSIAVMLFVIGQRFFVMSNLKWALGYAIVLGITPVFMSFAVLITNDWFSTSDALLGAISYFQYPFLVVYMLLMPMLVAIVVWYATVKTFRKISEG